MHEEDAQNLEEGKRFCKRTMEASVKKEASRQDKFREDLQSHVQQLDEVKEQQAKIIQDLTERLAQLDGDFVHHVRRVKDDHRRFDNAINLAERNVGDLKTNPDHGASSKGLRKDLEGVAKVVQSLVTDVRELKALPSAEWANAALPVESLATGGRLGGGALSAAMSRRGSFSRGPDGQIGQISVNGEMSPENRNFAQIYEKSVAMQRLMNPPDLPEGWSEEVAGVGVKSEEVDKLKKRIDQVELVERELLKTFENLERRVNQFYSHTVSMTGLRNEFNDLEKMMKDFQWTVTQDVIKMQTVELSHAITNFRSRWDLFASKMSPRQVFKAWLHFLTMRHNLRDALSKTKSLYSKRHAGARLQSWYYITQRNLTQQGVQHLEERSLAFQAQQEALSATVAKRERIATEQAKDLHCRISMVEKRVEVHSQKKADQDYVQDIFNQFEQRYEREVDPVAQKQAIEDLREAISQLSQGKTDVAVSERHGHRLRDLAQEMREKFHRHDDIFETKASKADNNLKANAQLVEQTVLLLARQADHLATLVSEDLELFRGVLGRFLELSPDIRKAALSLGLESNDRCMACRATDRKMVLAPLLGSDNAHYRLSPDTLDTTAAQTQKIVHETLRFPSQLTSSLVAGKALGSAFGEQWRPIEPPAGAEAPASGRPASGRSSPKSAAPRELAQSEPQVLLARLRKMILQEPGWIACTPADDAGAPSGRGSPTLSAGSRVGASPRRTFLVEDEARTSITRPSSSRPVQVEEEARPSIGRPSGSRPSTAGSGAGSQVNSRGTRQLVGAKNYFRGSLTSLESSGR